MFGASKSTTATSPGKRGACSAIGTDVTMAGDIACAALVQGPASRITGTVSATARITGDVAYDSIAINPALESTARCAIEMGTRPKNRFGSSMPATKQPDPRNQALPVGFDGIKGRRIGV